MKHRTPAVVAACLALLPLHAAALGAQAPDSMPRQQPAPAAQTPPPLPAPAPVGNEAPGPLDVRNEMFAGGEAERYLRVLQIAGGAPAYPWAIRSFSPAEVDRLSPGESAGPWGARISLSADSARGPGLELRLVRPRARVLFNSAFPYGRNDGPLWAGKGLTESVEGGVTARVGPLSVALVPVFFRAENAEFELAPNGRDGPRAFADPRFPDNIDLPQRFGDGAYTRLDPGESTLRLDWPALSLGVSTASQQWGPAWDQPLVLGNNAGGFAHAFLGTGRPLNVGIGRLHARAVWGLLEQSDIAARDSTGDERYATGLVAVFTPRGLPTLELGAARFFHTDWPGDGLSAGLLFQPFQGLLKNGLRDKGESDVSNQLGSLFLRWTLPRSGFELYAEFAREDHNSDLRDLLVEPDHNSAYVLGFSRVWGRPDGGALTVVRAEVLNSTVSHLRQVRNQGVFYTHHLLRQGHTQRGQILGASKGYGGLGSLLAVERYHRRGRWTLGWSREGRTDESGAGRDPEALHALEGEALWFAGRAELSVGTAAAFGLDRNFGEDRFNLHARVGVRWRP